MEIIEEMELMQGGSEIRCGSAEMTILVHLYSARCSDFFSGVDLTTASIYAHC